MRLILSRKGFDSTFGKVPSPIFPDGRMLSLPIPSEASPIKYADVNWGGQKIGPIVSTLTRGRIASDARAHLDPDLRPDSLPRQPEWRPLFGQTAGAQGHLRNMGVRGGDIFLFFGLFRKVVVRAEIIEWDKASPSIHAIWGWMQIDKILPVDNTDFAAYGWAKYHPHLNWGADRNNVLYVARESLILDGVNHGDIPGAGVFPRFSDNLRLTAKCMSTSVWDLPGWIFPAKGQPPLSYHGESTRWTRDGDRTILRTVGKGQEFVLDCAKYPESISWIASLLTDQH